MLGDVDNVDLEIVEAHGLEKVLGVGIDIELAGLGLGNIQSGNLRNVLILALTLLLLQLERDTADRATLDTLHKVGGVTSNLVAKALGGNDSDLIAKTLVGLKVERQLGVVALDVPEGDREIVSGNAKYVAISAYARSRSTLKSRSCNMHRVHHRNYAPEHAEASNISKLEEI